MRFPLVMAVLVLALLPACGGGSGASDSTPANSGGGAGSLIIGRPDGIYEYGIESGQSQPLLKPDQVGSYFLDPAVSPDASRLAYVVQPPPRLENGVYDAGSDLWIAARDGSGARLIYEHEVSNQLVRFPRWQDDTHVMAIIQEIRVDGGQTSVAYTLQSIDVETGERASIVDEALAFDVSPDGQRVAYAVAEGQPTQVLNAIDVTGENPSVLVPRAENLSPFNFPRYSPDGASIAFAAADQTLAPPSPTGRLVSAGPLRAPRANGLPEDIWVMDAEGSRPRMVGDLNEDLPGLAWSGDGEHIYALGSLGLWDINVRTGAVTRIGEGVFHATIAWAP